MESLDVHQRSQHLQWRTRWVADADSAAAKRVIDQVAVESAGCTPADMAALVEAVARDVATAPTEDDSAAVAVIDAKPAFDSALAALRVRVCVVTTEVVPNAPQQAHTAATATQGAALTEIGAPAIPNVRWADIGGLAHARDEILDMVKCE